MAGAPQPNLNFYTGVLGLRLVKRTVNFDAPEVYHLYYGNQTGAPGTILTFFPFPGITPGRIGAGQATRTSFSIPAEAVGYWQDRLSRFGVGTDEQAEADRVVLNFRDPDGMPLALVANDQDQRPGTAVGSVPAASSIRGFYGVTLTISRPEGTLDILTRSLEHQLLSEGKDRFLLGTDAQPGSLIELVANAQAPQGIGGSGTVHHIAFATPTDDSQRQLQRRLQAQGFYPTQIMDRQYFHSIYFREPGGVLFEVATVPPGFLYDEAEDALGTGLKLPEWVEPHRAEIERGLAPLSLEEALRVSPSV